VINEPPQSLSVTPSTGTVVDAPAPSAAGAITVASSQPEVFTVSGVSGSNATAALNGGAFTITDNFGTLVVNQQTGAYTFVLNEASSTVESLAKGSTTADVFTVSLVDGHGNTGTSGLTIEVSEAGQPISAAVSNGSVVDGSSPSASGTMTATAANAHPELFSVASVSGGVGGGVASLSGGLFTIVDNFGTLVVSQQTGAYTFTLNEASPTVENLQVGATATDSFTYTVQDGHGDSTAATFTVGISEQGQTIASAAAIAPITVSDPQQLTGSSQLTDIGHPEVFTVTGLAGGTGGAPPQGGGGSDFTIVDNFGTLVVTPDGHATFTLNANSPAVENLPIGTQIDTFTLAVTDGHGDSGVVQLTVDINEQSQTITEAAEVLRGAVAARPHLSEAWWHLGGVLREQCRFAEAAECQQRVLALDPDHVGAHLQLAYILLTLGDLPAGSVAHEYRWGKGHNRRYPIEGKKLWNGEALPGGTLLLWGELGFGDVVQFVRFAKLARRRVGRVLLHCHPALAVAMATAQGLDAVIPIGAPLPEFDAFLPVCSLMRVFGTTLDTIPDDVPYLAVNRDRAAPLAPMLAGDGLKLGLVWAGNPRHGNDRRRSLPLAALAPILDMPGIRFFSLQTAAFTGEPDRRGAELRASRWASGVADIASALHDFADTAAALSQLDLLISVDTAVVHLAGALGLPAWVLLPFNADWRWLRNRDDSPWYPTLRLYRQDESFEWGPVIERVRRDLREHLVERGLGPK